LVRRDPRPELAVSIHSVVLGSRKFPCTLDQTTYNRRVRTQQNKPVSRQRLWQKQQVALGRCAICGAKRPSDLKILCRRCQDKANELHMRLYYASKERR
jgi:uncharacterized paraquat-inducible protein A